MDDGAFQGASQIQYRVQYTRPTEARAPNFHLVRLDLALLGTLFLYSAQLPPKWLAESHCGSYRSYYPHGRPEKNAMSETDVMPRDWHF